jgi:TrmH family RNA methyltransferase
LATATAANLHADWLTDDFVRLSDDQARRLADTEHSSGVFAVCAWREPSLDRVLDRDPQLIVVCAQIRDPGNLGTVIRSADAFGADAVITTDASVDVTNPKTVRASVGSIFHLPIISHQDLSATVLAAKSRGMTCLAADADGVDLNRLAAAGGLRRPVVWIMGNEAWGLPPADRALADQVVSVPMWGQAESLNLAAASAVLLYATASVQHG